MDQCRIDLNTSDLDEIYEESEEILIEKSENKKEKSSNEESQRIINHVVIQIVEMIATSDDNWKKFNKLLMILIFGIILVGVPRGVYVIIFKSFFSGTQNRSNTEIIEILAVLIGAWKLIKHTMDKMVDYIFLVDKTLINCIMRLVQPKNYNIQSHDEKDKKPTTFNEVLIYFLSYLQSKLETKKEEVDK